MTTQAPAETPTRARCEFAAKAFIVVAFLGSLAAGALRLADRAFDSPAHRVDLGAWTVLERPAWCGLDDVREIRDASGLPGFHASVFDTSVLASLDRWLARSPRVRRVAGVTRIHPDRVQAVLELRRPAVAVRLAGPADRFVEADEEGVALGPPQAVRPVRDGSPLRVVVGAPGGAPAPGGRFGPEVTAAAALADSLDSFGDADGRALLASLDKIDVSNHGGRTRPGASEILLGAMPTPASGAETGASPPPLSPRCVVEWGRPFADDADPSELPFDAKASHLLQALRLFPGLSGIRTVRVAFRELVVVPEGGRGPAHLERALEIDGGVQAK